MYGGNAPPPTQAQFSNPPNYNPNFHASFAAAPAYANNNAYGGYPPQLQPQQQMMQPPQFQQQQQQQMMQPPQFQQAYPGYAQGVDQGASYGMPHDSGYARQRPPPQQQPATPFGDAAAVATAAAAAAVFRGDATAGAQLLETQRLNLAARWMPGVAAVWDKLRSYFAVSHRYVGLKLRALVVPWIKRAWRRQKLGDQDVVSYALPVDDENAPDLYIPLVSFLTFALVTGYVKGQSGTFTPEVLAHILTSCAGFQLFELTLYSAGLYLSGAGAPLLDLTCYTGYKYVSLCVNMLAGLLAGVRAYYAALLWTALSSSYFMLKTMAQTVPAKTSAAAPRREFLVCGLGLIQGFSIWFLGYNRDL